MERRCVLLARSDNIDDAADADPPVYRDARRQDAVPVSGAAQAGRRAHAGVSGAGGRGGADLAHLLPLFARDTVHLDGELYCHGVGFQTVVTMVKNTRPSRKRRAAKWIGTPHVDQHRFRTQDHSKSYTLLKGDYGLPHVLTKPSWMAHAYLALAWPARGQARCEVVNVRCSIKFGVRCITPPHPCIKPLYPCPFAGAGRRCVACIP
jgi:hypothetical protein